MFSHSTSNVMVSSVAMSNVPLATPVLPAAVTLVGRDMPYNTTLYLRAHRKSDTSFEW